MARNKPDKHAAQASLEASMLDASVDVTLRDLQRELAAAQQRLETARMRLTETQSKLTESQAALDRIESRHLAGRTSDNELASAHAAQAAAKKAHAVALADMEEAERLTTLLPAAITEAKQAAQTAVRDNLRRLYAEKLARLVALVTEAKQLSDELDALSYQANQQLNVRELLSLPGGGVTGLLDLGEQGGFVQQGGGMTNMASAWLTNTRAGRNQPSMADLWVKEAEQYLARTPEQRAAEDVERRKNTLARAKEKEREAIVNELARQELRKRISARYGIRPDEVMV